LFHNGQIVLLFRVLIVSFHSHVHAQDTDFASVSEGLLNLAIAATKLPDHQKAAKHRLLQCIKVRPRLRSVVAWIACNKGSQLSSSFRRIVNQVLVRAGTGREGGFAAEQDALSTTLQVYE